MPSTAAPTHPDEVTVLSVSTEVRLLGLTAADFDDDRKQSFAVAVAESLDGVYPSDVTNVAATDAADDDGDAGGQRRRLATSGVDISFDISIRVDTYTKSVADDDGGSADDEDGETASAFASLVDDLSTAVNNGGLIDCLGEAWTFESGSVSVDASSYDPPTGYSVVVHAAPTAVPSAAPTAVPSAAPSVPIEEDPLDVASALLSSPLMIGVMLAAACCFGTCCWYCRRPKSTAHERRARARNPKFTWDDEVASWDDDLPTSPLHGATNDHGRRLEPVRDAATPDTPVSFFSGWHLSNFVRSRSRSPSSARSWRSVGSSVRGRRSPGGSIFSWFIGGGDDGGAYGPDGQFDMVEMQAQVTPLAQDPSASVWCEPQEEGEEEEEAEAGKATGKRVASRVVVTAAAEEEGEAEEEGGSENVFAPLSPANRPSRRNVAGGGGGRRRTRESDPAQ